MGPTVASAHQPTGTHPLLGRSPVRLAFVLVILAGLLNFPTLCTCGAAIAHAHSLFLLPYHHHDQAGSVTADTGPATEPSSVTVATGNDPVIHASDTGLLTSQPVADTVAWLSAWLGFSTLFHWIADLPQWVGQIIEPEPSPP
ncbi:hypothetical protein [Nitrolancea hollandica]|uniref:Uncharacterized protein n=1 Tax=Nitrolancea hollandica Lb TaxID=1129897 RepID=I4EHX9_9BACT|nr:hypothetical protein [Nitrolancea hollandica]CCF84291.1 hypothetical protein NITHO_3310008 [Nitrolancea hollandica Lb]